MVLALMIFIIFSTYIVFSYRMKFAYVMSLYFLGCSVLIFTGNFYFIAISAYQYINAVDFFLLKMLAKIKLDIYTAAIIANVGVSLFMLPAIASFLLIFPKKYVTAALMVIPIIFVFVINLPSVSWKIYVALNADYRNLAMVLKSLKTCSTVLYFAYLFMPILWFLIYIISTHIFLKKQCGLTCIFCIVLMYMIIYLLFGNGIYAPVMFYNLDLNGFPTKPLGMYNEELSVTLSILCVVLINICILWYSKPFERFGKTGRRRFVRQSSKINENVYMLLHVYKNKFLCIEKLISLCILAENSGDGEEVERLLKNASVEAKDAVEKISRTLNTLNVITIDYHVFTIESCISDAVKKIGDIGIQINKNYDDGHHVVLGNKNHIVESIINILRNSIEAIKQKSISGGRIDISIYSEADMLSVTITDNGCGIPKKNKKYIFRPFYTTKDKKIGNGLGLDYIKRVMAIHGGGVKVRSTENVYTTVILALPIYNRLASGKLRKGMLL